MGMFTWFNKKRLTDDVYLEEDTPETNMNQPDSMYSPVSTEVKINNDSFEVITEKIVEDVIPDTNDFDVAEIGVYAPTLDLSNYTFPNLSLLRKQEHTNGESQAISTERIIKLLNSFGIKIKSVKANIGVIITLYEIVLEEGIRIATLRKHQEDISVGLAVSGIFISPIPERGSVGIIIPNRNPQVLTLSSILETQEFKLTTCELPVIIGKR